METSLSSFQASGASNSFTYGPGREPTAYGRRLPPSAAAAPPLGAGYVCLPLGLRACALPAFYQKWCASGPAAGGRRRRFWGYVLHSFIVYTFSPPSAVGVLGGAARGPLLVYTLEPLIRLRIYF